MNDPRSRPLFVSDKLLRAEDMALEQRFQSDGYHLADSALHTYGIAAGLDLSASQTGHITVAPGFAFDAAGEQLSLDAPVVIDLQTAPSSTVWITIRYGETPTEGGASAQGTFYRRVVVAPVIAVRSAGQSSAIAAGTELVLGRVELSVYREVVAIDPRERRLSGVVVGQLDLLNYTANAAQIAAASDPGSLAIHAPQTDVFAATVVRGSVGASADPATPSFVAGLEIVGIPKVPGHGKIWFGPPDASAGTSFSKAPLAASTADFAVYGDGTYFSGELSAGDTLFAEGPSGIASATILVVDGPNLLAARLDPSSPPPPSEPTPFAFQPRLLARIRRGDGQALLAVTGSGLVGIGTHFPRAELHVAAGDLGLGPGGNLFFDQEGTIEGGANDNAIGFSTKTGELSFVESGDLAFTAGALDASSPPTLFLQGSTGFVGIGTTEPLDALTVNGVIQATGGFIFAGGTNQKTGVVPIPIGTIVDWWQPLGSQALTPMGFQICDGSTVDDPESPMKGTTLPDLTNLFVRAVVSYDQVASTGGSAEHTHDITLTKHNHPMSHTHPIAVAFDATSDTNGIYIAGNDYSRAAHTHDFPSTSCAPPTVPTGTYAGTASAPTGPGSAIPKSMFLLKIMRVL